MSKHVTFAQNLNIFFGILELFYLFLYKTYEK